MISRLFARLVLKRPWLAFLVMCGAFALFGLCTLNLFMMFRLNVGLIADHGLMALADGAALQMLELLLTLVLGMAAYVVFKACEHDLVARLVGVHVEEKH